MNLKNLNRSTKSNIITFGIVIGFYLLIQILSAAGMVTNSFAGQLVPICAYVVMAVSLNLTVGMLGELSLGHAGFMSVGAFAGTLVWVSLYDTTFPKPAALLLAFVVGGVVAGWVKTGNYCEALQWGVAAGSASAFCETLATGEEIRRVYDETINIIREDCEERMYFR